MNQKIKGNQKNGLGKGLDAILEGSVFMTEKGAKKGDYSSIKEIPVEQIKTNPFQPRQDFEQRALIELSDSIKIHGIIQPLTVRIIERNCYELISGERRLQASKIAGLVNVPVYIREANDTQMLEMALVENIQREDLNPIELSLSYQRLLAECDVNQEELASKLGKDRTTINNYLRLLKLPPEIQIALRDKKINMGHARAIVNVENLNKQISIFKEIIEKGLSVRNVEELVRLATLQANEGNPEKKKSIKVINSETKQICSKLVKQFRTKVKITTGTHGKGVIKISFASDGDFARILKLLEKPHQ